MARGDGFYGLPVRRRATSGNINIAFLSDLIYRAELLAGNESSGFADGIGTTARFSSPRGLDTLKPGGLLVADLGNHLIRRVSLGVSNPGGTLTFAGTVFNDAGVAGDTDGAAEDANFNLPADVAIGLLGGIFVGDSGNNKIRRMDFTGATTTLAGSGIAGGDDGTGEAATFNSPRSLVVDAEGEIYVADFSGHKIRRVTVEGVVTTVAGSGSPSFVNGTGELAGFHNPNGLAIDKSGNLFVADAANHVIRKIVLDTQEVTTFAGSTQGFQDGTFDIAKFNNPTDMAIGFNDVLFLADTGNSKIRRIDSNGNVTTIRGFQPSYFNGTQIRELEFPNLNALALDLDGTIYVLDGSQIFKLVPEVG